MLTEKRYEVILKLLDEKKSITVTEVKELLHTSESTVRRDFNALDSAGKLVKVFGGAVANEVSFASREPTVAQKVEVNKEEKQLIARYAAALIEPEDFVYLDAGTTTAYMIDYISEHSATYVTNAVDHGKRLAEMDFHVLLIGGELKGRTEAVVGSQAILTLGQYHFTKGFAGVNGITKRAGFTTPDASEAQVKKIALEQSQKKYILGDASKFGEISSITFAPFESAMVITDREPPEMFQKCRNIIVV